MNLLETKASYDSGKRRKNADLGVQIWGVYLGVKI